MALRGEQKQQVTGKVMLHGIGELVRDRSRNTVALVVDADPETKMLSLRRPSGTWWPARDHHCRPADEQDAHEWDALQRLRAASHPRGPAEIPAPHPACALCETINTLTQQAKERGDDLSSYADMAQRHHDRVAACL